MGYKRINNHTTPKKKNQRKTTYPNSASYHTTLNCLFYFPHGATYPQFLSTIGSSQASPPLSAPAPSPG